MRRAEVSLASRVIAATAVVATLAVSVVASGAGDAFAQAGAGAERYEVTISPPKRPGTEPAPDATADPGAATPAAPAAGDGAGAGNASVPNPADSADGAAPASATAAVTRSGPVAAPTPVAKPSGPPRTLQVAAFRQHDRAESLRSELAESFPDVAILEVQSGGEPLYRVNVGRLPKGPGLDELKKRLASAGFPSFDVAAPAKPASD